MRRNVSILKLYCQYIDTNESEISDAVHLKRGIQTTGDGCNGVKQNTQLAGKPSAAAVTTQHLTQILIPEV